MPADGVAAVAAARPKRGGGHVAAAPDHETGPQGHLQGPGRFADERRERREGYFCGF